MLLVLFSIIGIILICILVLAINSSGKLAQSKDTDGNVIENSLAEKQFIEIGGIKQGFFLRSENPENPVILFLHGGPGSPEFARSYRYETSERLEKYGIGMMHNKFSQAGLIRDFLFFGGYTLSEKMKYIKGIIFSLLNLWDKVVYDNFFESSIVFEVPVYILQGKHDYQVSYTLARKYFDVIKAPDKAFYTFDNSAHSPHFEEREKFIQIIRNISLQ